jgi:hypothetical protein
MKPYLIFIFLSIGFTSSSCERNNVDQIFPFDVEVLGINLDCKQNEIKFSNDLDKVIELFGKSVIDSVYIAGNLSDDLKIPGLKIVLNIGKPSTYEIGACTTMGPSLNWVWITNAKPK